MKKIKIKKIKIKVKVNGKLSIIEDNLSLFNYIKKLKVPLKKVAIELNQEIMDKNKLSKIKLKKDDKIEIVHFIGGG
jgi:thiamine biosynthesis protein ThiS